MESLSLPPNHKSLVQEVYGEPLVVKDLPTPQPTSGSVVLKILYSPIVSYMRDVYNGKRQYAYSTPLTPGTSAIARVAAIGPDTTLLKEGDLVHYDCTIHGRDDYEAVVLLGLSLGGNEGSKHLMEGEWRHGTFAEYAKAPLENVFKLDETRLCRELEYSIPQLCWILQALIPYGGLRSIGLQAGETIIIAPATGPFGSAATVVSLAMGARVIAMGRNLEALAGLKKLGPGGRVETAQIVGDAEKEMAELAKFGKADVFFDISPPEVHNLTHFTAAVQSLKRNGRVSIMGGLSADLQIPFKYVVGLDITLKGKFMYSREDILAFWNLMTSSVLNARDLVKVVGEHQLEDWEKAFQVAWDHARLGQLVVFKPS